MAAFNRCETLRIKVLEDSVETGLFVVCVKCDDFFLLSYWFGKEPFHNELLEQTDLVKTALPDQSLGLEFVLRVKHRAAGLANAHYWSPFVLALCLDALRFGFLLPPSARVLGIEKEMQEKGELLLQR